MKDESEANASQRYRPLARGDACHGCKNRKIRCSAERPACANCIKRGRQCIYRPTNAPAPAQASGSSDGAPSRRPSEQSQPYAAEAAPLASSSSLSLPGLPAHQHAHHYQHHHALPMLTPAPGPIPLSLSPSYFDFDQASVALPAVDLAGALPDLGAGGLGPGPGGLSGLGSFLPTMGYTPGGEALQDQTLPAEFDCLDLSWLDEADLAQGLARAEPESSHNVLSPECKHWRRIERGDGTIKPITPEEQRHLLWLYFTNQRIFGLEMHVATFYANLASADPEAQPHPCLLNAMYLVACRASPSAALREREGQFFWAAYDAMTSAIAGAHHFLDAVRAGTLLGVWLYSAGHYPMAVEVIGKAVSLAVACGLHDIPSSAYVAPRQRRRIMRRHPVCYLPPAQSQIELAERIYAFWAVYFVEVGACTTQEWPVRIEMERVRTPLPRPWSEYEHADPHLASCDETLAQLMAAERPACEHTTDLARTVKAVALMHRATLTTLAASSYLAPVTPRRIHSPADSRVDADKAAIRRALDVYTASLPEHLKTAARGQVSVQAATLLFIIGDIEVQLLDNDSYAAPNDAIEPVRRLLGVMRLLGDADTGDISVFVIMIWVHMARLLCREGRRLERIGDYFASATVDADVAYIVKALRAKGGRLRLANVQADHIERWLIEGASDDDDADLAERTGQL
ncbi:hypothetical protein Q5752_003322 [Cryptotrichosporon argae]